jgi:Tfp pilus assembly protein FimV
MDFFKAPSAAKAQSLAKDAVATLTGKKPAPKAAAPAPVVVAPSVQEQAQSWLSQRNNQLIVLGGGLAAVLVASAAWKKIRGRK